MLSHTAEYALRAVLHIAEREGAEPVSVEVIAEELDLPRNYLSKTLHALAKRGVLRSTRGPSGGFQLARPAEEVTMFEVIQPFDDVEARRTCLLGREECNDARPCSVHHRWKDVAGSIAAFFRETTVGEIVADRRAADPASAASAALPLTGSEGRST